MGIQLGGKRARRSYADYRPPGRKRPPQNDIFRVAIYLAIIGGAVWVYLNPTIAQGWLANVWPTPAATSNPAATGGGDATPEFVSPDQLAEQGQAKLHDGDLDAAIALYGQAAQEAPNQVEYHVELTRALLFKSALQYGSQRELTLQQALQAGNRAILADPERPEGYAIYGKTLDWSGKPEEASVQLSRALELSKEYAAGQSYMAEALVDLQRYDQARQTIDEALRLDPKNVDVLRDNGYILESLGDYASAATQYEAALAIEPNLAYVKMDLARAYRSVGRYNEALDQFFAVDTQMPKNALVQFELGRTYETYIGDPNSALEYYQQSTEIDPNYALPWVRIGTIKYLQAAWDEAIAAFEQAISLGITGNLNVFYQLGVSYANLNQCGQAVTNLRKAQALVQPDDTQTQENIADALAKCPQSLTPTAPPVTPTATPTKKP